MFWLNRTIHMQHQDEQSSTQQWFPGAMIKDGNVQA